MTDGITVKLPAVAGQVLIKGNDSDTVSGALVKKYRSATRTDIYNAVCSLACHMSAPKETQMKALKTLVRYLVSTRNCGLVLAPNEIWGNRKQFKFEIWGRSDSDYATNLDDHHSVFGGRVFLNNAPVTFWSATQKFVTLSH